jgi:hypothetical protein
MKGYDNLLATAYIASLEEVMTTCDADNLEAKIAQECP